MFENWFVFRVLYQPSSNLCIRVLCPWFADTYDDEQKEDWWKESIGGGGEGDLNNWLQVEELGATSPGWFCSGMFVFGCRLDWLMPDSNSGAGWRRGSLWRNWCCHWFAVVLPDWTTKNEDHIFSVSPKCVCRWTSLYEVYLGNLSKMF